MWDDKIIQLLNLFRDQYISSEMFVTNSNKSLINKRNGESKLKTFNKLVNKRSLDRDLYRPLHQVQRVFEY